MHDLYLDDFAVGDRFVTPGLTVTESHIIDFAFQWDPQPFHIDVEAAARHEMGSLLASGFHTLCLTFRLFQQSGVLARCNITGAGLDNLRWLRPVRPGDTIHAEAVVSAVRPSRSKPDRGTLAMRHSAVEHRGGVVMEVDCVHVVRRRPALAAAAKKPAPTDALISRPEQ